MKCTILICCVLFSNRIFYLSNTIPICPYFFYLSQLNGTVNKVQSVSQQIASKLNQDCRCEITTAYITAAQLSCDPQEVTHVIYRARLSSTPDVNSDNLANVLQQWISGGSASIVVDLVQLNLYPTCTVVIESYSDPVCYIPTLTTESPDVSDIGEIMNNNTGNNSTTNALIAVVITAVILIAVIIMAFVIYQRIISSGKYNLR